MEALILTIILFLVANSFTPKKETVKTIRYGKRLN